MEYQDLQDKIRGPISNIQNLKIFKSVGERFVDVFREEVARNPKATVNEVNANKNRTTTKLYNYKLLIQELENCIGCMITVANVKLVRRCETEGVPEACINCYCRPMWCLDCLGKW